MKNKKVTIIIEGGVVQDVIKSSDIDVIIKDYDIEDSDEDILKEDEYGEFYFESRY